MSKAFGRNRICVIADDLTGACDAAAPFARRGARTTVVLRPAEPGFGSPGTEVQALCTGTRHVAPEKAAEVVRGLARDLDTGEFDQIFKKIDSVFRGNTFIEIAAAICALPHGFAVIAPAFPALGRICTDGELHVQDLSGSRSLPLRKQLSEAGLEPAWIAPMRDIRELEAEMRAAISRGSNAVFCEATSDDELLAVVEASRALDKPILWVGSGGLAHALAQTLYSSSSNTNAGRGAPEIADGVLLAFTGSEHSVSMRQFALLRKQHSIRDWPATTASRFAAPVNIFQVERGQTTDAQIREAVYSIELDDVGCLLMNGGETALQVCRALGIGSIYLKGEFETGIPIGLASGGRFDGCTVILKSGGFGDADLLSRIAGHCAYGKELTT